MNHCMFAVFRVTNEDKPFWAQFVFANIRNSRVKYSCLLISNNRIMDINIE